MNDIRIIDFLDQMICASTQIRSYIEAMGKDDFLSDKRTQDADINRACEYWQDWQRRLDDEK